MIGMKGKTGGKREGAGRPAGINQKSITIKFDSDLVEYLNQQENRNRFVNICVREKKEREGK